MEWIIRNQFGRRNLSAYQRAKLALKLEPVIQEKAKENLKTSTGGKNPRPLQKSDNPAIDTQKELAQIAGVSHDTIHKVKIIEDKGSEELIGMTIFNFNLGSFDPRLILVSQKQNAVWLKRSRRTNQRPIHTNK